MIFFPLLKKKKKLCGLKVLISVTVIQNAPGLTGFNWNETKSFEPFEWRIQHFRGVTRIFIYKGRRKGIPKVLFAVQFSLVAQSGLILCYPRDCSTPGLFVYHQLLEFTQTHVHWVGDAIQPSNLLSSPSPPAFNLSQHQDLFKWVSSSHQVVRVLEFQLQYQSFQWKPREHLP